MTGPVNGNLATDSYGERLKSAMTERRMGVGQLARATGVDIRLLRKYRSGASVPRDYFGYPTRNAERIADALGLPVMGFFPPDSKLEEAA